MNYSETASFNTSWQRSGWGSKKSQESRFAMAEKLLQINGYKAVNLVDFGCNDGAFQEFLIAKGIYVDNYIGFDLCKQALDNFAVKSLPNAVSYQSYESLFSDYNLKADIVTCIGVLQILGIDWRTILKQINGLVHEGSLLLLSSLSLDWEKFNSPETADTPNPSNQWHRAEDIINFMNTMNFKLLQSCSILPREGTCGEIGYGYDMFLLFHKLDASR